MPRLGYPPRTTSKPESRKAQQIPIQTQANNTITVTFKDAALTLRVLPRITAVGTVIMKITIENAAAGLQPRSVNGIPTIDTQRAVTSVARARRRDDG